MAILKNPFIIKKMPWHANMTEMNHLGAAMIAKPAVLQGKMNQLFSTQLYSQNPLETLRSMGQVGTREETTTSWEYEMKGANTRPLVVVENVEANATAYGKYNTPFKMSLDEDWYLPGDIMFPGSNDKKYQLRIQEKVGRKGRGFIYVVVPNGPKDLSIPARFLATGQKWTKLFAQYEEAAEQSGSTQYALPITLHNRMSRFRKTYRVTGDVQQEVLAVKIPDSKGVLHDSWVNYAEVEYWQQWHREKAIATWFSRSTDTVKGANGRPTYAGPGLQEMLEEGHIWRPSFITGRGFEEYIMDIYYGRTDFGQRNVKCFTGEYGLLEANRIMTDLMQRHGFIMANSNFNPVQPTKSPYHSNAFSYGFKFTEWKMPNGSTLEFIHNPLYDDKTLNFEVDPVTGYPIASMRYTFLDFTNGKNGQNISLVNKKNAFKNWYVAGGTSPYGPTTKGLGSHAGDYYEVHVQDQYGVHVEDVTRCGEIIVTRKGY